MEEDNEFRNKNINVDSQNKIPLSSENLGNHFKLKNKANGEKKTLLKRNRLPNQNHFHLETKIKILNKKVIYLIRRFRNFKKYRSIYLIRLWVNKE